jgi:uncharacterized RDD family membrane protein YckC
MPPSPGGYPPQVRYASWINRVGSFLIDGVITAIPAAFAQLFYVGHNGSIGAGRIFGATILYFATFVVWLYNRVIRAGRTGQSWGKVVTGSRIVGMQSGVPIGSWRAFLRDLCHFFDDPCGIFPLGYLWPIWDRLRQTFADKIMRTVVIMVR